MTIEDVLRDRELLSLAELADLLGTEPTALQQELDELVRAGRVECLRPIAPTSGETPRAAVFYRLKKPTDADYLWELDFTTPSRRASKATAF